MRRLFLIAALACGAVASGCDQPPEASPADRAATACAAQFGKGTPADADCQVQLALKAEAKLQAEHMKEAERQAGQ